MYHGYAFKADTKIPRITGGHCNANFVKELLMMFDGRIDGVKHGEDRARNIIGSVFIDLCTVKECECQDRSRSV